ncbi:MAG TPA: NAD(P)/FAD-dependent oxidoreductase [Microbacteriaceae bacterium]|nr:NAD(P)/FAD-dependent oxidoreductase [Microbacteriaceae bacterium]
MRHVAVAIIGAGFAGIGAAIQLERSGRGDFVVLERAAAIGGTWRDNVYPGVACDIPSHLYSFSFMPNPAWTRRFAPGEEIRAYLESCVDAAGIRDRIRLRDGLLDATWTDGHWQLHAAHGEFTADTLVLACGRLTEPRLPDVPGLTEFAGPVVHSARWDPALDLRGRRVAVVGTGASAVQLAPELARDAEVILVQRTPAWVLPRGDHAYRPEEQAAFDADPLLVDAIRREAYLAGEALVPQRLGDLDALDWAQARALAHLHAQVPDPVLRAALMPDYELGCKRAVFSDDLYPAIASGAIVLEPSALVAVRGSRTRSGDECGGASPHSSRVGRVVAASGREYEVDAIVLATGFETVAQPYARRVRGIDGETLAEHWADGMVSVASTMVAGFPDLYVLDGPNASLGHNSSILMIEAQLDYLLDALRHREATGHPLVPSAAAEAAYTRRIDESAAGTVWLTGGCRSWYVDRGRLALLWPDTVDAFRERGARFDPADFRTSVGA